MKSRFALLLVICWFPIMASAQSWGLGVRLGDPTGLSLKKYWSGHAFELSVGRTHYFYGPGYYRGRYDHWYDDQRFNYPAHEYLSYRANRAFGVQAHYLIQKDVRNAGGLDWYYGFGGQLRTIRYFYSYRYKPAPGPDWVVVYDEPVTDLDLGMDGVIGLEYKFTGAPLAIFLDGTLFMEVFDNPFFFGSQVGLGVRFNFGS